MGSVNNERLRKPATAKGLAQEHRRCQPKGVLAERTTFSLGAQKLLHNKKVKAGTRVKAVSGAH